MGSLCSKKSSDFIEYSAEVSPSQRNSQTKSKTLSPYKLIHVTSDWEMVKQSLLDIVEKKPNLNLEEFFTLIQKFIKLYDPSSENTNLDTLQTLFQQQNQEERLEWEKTIFPRMIALLLKTPEIFPNQIPLLIQGHSQKVKLTKEQCACLMSHMFICTTISQKENKKLPSSFNFAELYSSSLFANQHIKLEKLKCLANYFKRIFTQDTSHPTQFLVFERLVFGEDQEYSMTDQWKNSQQKLLNLKIQPTGKIEETQGAIEIDFANKFLGGGVIKKGTAQEEIMFITSPETLIGVLFSEVMLDSEAILIQGAEIYCKYKGYLSTFQYDGDFQGTHPVREDGVLDRTIVAIDALNFRRYPEMNQFSESSILRELNKAYIGFLANKVENKSLEDKAIATGKWGCGDFHGHIQLKFMIQWLAASMACREIIFYSFGDLKDLKYAEDIVELYKGRDVGMMMHLILNWCEEKLKTKEDLFTFLRNIHHKEKSKL